MARSRRPNEPSSYQAQPEIPPELRRRFELIRAVLGERTTISEAARELGIARVNMQTLVHRAEAAIVSSLHPRPTGPAPKPTSEKQLEAEVLRLQKENARLQNQLQAADEMMAAAGEIIRSLRGLSPTPTSRSSSRTKPAPSSDGDEDPERASTVATTEILRRALTRLRTKHEAGARAARMLGVDTKTLRRWLARLIAGEPLIRQRGGKMRAGPPVAEARVRELVLDLHGLPGAASLAHSVEGVSRRRAALLKREVLTSAERSRKAEAAHVEVTRVGVVRGFDAMHLPESFALVAADARVPYRTTVQRVDRYDAARVAAALAADFEQHGAPLVLRCDRASCHTAPAVLSVLERHGVLLLQGPAYHAPYYGQLERQNREHRAWWAWSGDEPRYDQAALDRMKSALNEAWRRPTLGWTSAAQHWRERGTIDDDRDELRHNVENRAANLCARGVVSELAMRLAIEQALIEKGYLRVNAGRETLCE